MLNAKTVCDNCNAELNLTQNNILSSWFTVKNTHKKLKIIYCVCHKCGNKKVLQIDDEKTLSQLQEAKRQYFQMARIRSAGGRVTKRQKSRYIKLNNDLDNRARIELKNKYKNCTVVNRDTELIIK